MSGHRGLGGITRRGEQYAGFRALPSATSEPSVERGHQLIREHGSIRAVLKATHPNTGGDEADLKAERLGWRMVHLDRKRTVQSRAGNTLAAAPEVVWCSPSVPEPTDRLFSEIAA